MPDTGTPNAAAFHGVGTPQFYIPATSSLAERRPRTLKHGDSFAVFDHNGDIVSGPGSPEGLFHQDTRHLSLFELSLDGERPMLLSSTLRLDNAALTCDLTNPDIFRDGALAVERDTIHLLRTKFLWDGACYERLSVRNFAAHPVAIRLAIRFGADFADLFEVRGSRRARRGTLHAPEVGADLVRLAYTGLDGLLRVTELRFEPVPDTLTADTATFELRLPPRGSREIHLAVAFREGGLTGSIRRTFLTSMTHARRALRDSSSRAASVATTHEVFNEVVRRSVSDLYMLLTDKPEGPYPYAGIPWFSTAFGRDGIITALETLWMDPEIARGVLGYLAANQATAEDPEADAEPGKILHETRGGEMAALGEVPFRRYYGSIDSTPLFVTLAGAYLERTGDLATARTLWPHVQAALDWMDRYGDRDGDGFLEYARQTESGLANQGWKDSHDSVFHADGSLARGPIALCEVQAYAYAARRAAAAIARRLGDHAEAVAQDSRADTLRTRFEEQFWDEDLGTYVLALDGDKQPCRVRASNAGHALLAGIAAPARARRVAAQLMGRDFLSGWGIRTVASGEARYNPMSYHNGSVWPHDNALIALGFARYGLRAETARLLEALLGAATYMDLRRLPELFCGFRRRSGGSPTPYPVACAPQAWAAAAPVAVLQACLGLGFDPEAGAVTFDRPTLPPSLDIVTLRRISIAGASVDVQLHRHGDGAALSVLRRDGEIRVLTTN
ncbi:amylo-alpha-1,6-glucosidase [Arenibaculum pallidiluteum]|uniref:amylo-alpha-1,6-glucosidase n=1 Tax=Arenibaculum pallidiluteum TaxID=2812559 RepID=UPI001A97A8B8|nr:amylo-alpha-1,6-glucosidase [Arenibaculum pallidiluteum]